MTSSLPDMSYQPPDDENTLDDIIQEDDAPAVSDIPNPPGGGIVDASHAAGENSEAEVGYLGHPGIDEGTE